MNPEDGKSYRLKSKRIYCWLHELGPLIFTTIFLWCKLVYFSVSLRSVWWATEESILQWIIAHPDIFSSSLATWMLLFWLLPLLPRIASFMILLLFNFVLTTLILVDMVHAHFYGDVPSIASFDTVYMLKWLVPSILNQLKPLHAVYYFDIIAGVLIAAFYVRSSKWIPRLEKKHRNHFSLGLLGAGLILAIPTVHLVMQDKSGLFAYTNLQRDFCSLVGPIPYHISDAIIQIGLSRQGVGEGERQHATRFLENVQMKRKHSSLFGIARGRNVIMISAESLQTFPIGLEIHGQAITPRLSAFARESLYFVNFYDQTHLGTTSDAEFMALQSLHPLATGQVVVRYYGNHFRGLPAILAEHGYLTLSACAEPGDFWNMNKMHRRYGFERSFFEEAYKIAEKIGPWMADKEFFKQTISILQTQKEPFMAYLISSSNHHPFKLSEKYRKLKLGDLEGTYIGDYLHSVHYFDQAFGEFVDGLRGTGLLDRSIIALYGDHQAFIEGSELGRIFKSSGWSEYNRLQIKKKVPFILRLPRGDGAGIRRVPGGHIDTAPTLLSLLGIDDNHVMLGKDLTQGEKSLVVFRDGSFVDGVNFFINRFGPTSNSTCYQMETGRQIDCRPLERERRDALERLEISDLILRGDLINVLQARGRSSAPKD